MPQLRFPRHNSVEGEGEGAGIVGGVLTPGLVVNVMESLQTGTNSSRARSTTHPVRVCPQSAIAEPRVAGGGPGPARSITRSPASCVVWQTATAPREVPVP